MIKNKKFIYLVAFLTGGVLFYILLLELNVFGSKFASAIIGNSNKIFFILFKCFLIGGSSVCMLYFFYSSKYLRQCFSDLLNKVTWPTWKELQNSSIVVAITSLIIAFIVFFMDKAFDTSLDEVYKLFNN